MEAMDKRNTTIGLSNVDKKEKLHKKKRLLRSIPLISRKRNNDFVSPLVMATNPYTSYDLQSIEVPRCAPPTLHPKNVKPKTPPEIPPKNQSIRNRYMVEKERSHLQRAEVVKEAIELFDSLEHEPHLKISDSIQSKYLLEDKKYTDIPDTFIFGDVNISKIELTNCINTLLEIRDACENYARLGIYEVENIDELEEEDIEEKISSCIQILNSFKCNEYEKICVIDSKKNKKNIDQTLQSNYKEQIENRSNKFNMEHPANPKLVCSQKLLPIQCAFIENKFKSPLSAKKFSSDGKNPIKSSVTNDHIYMSKSETQKVESDAICMNFDKTTEIDGDWSCRKSNEHDDQIYEIICFPASKHEILTNNPPYCEKQFSDYYEIPKYLVTLPGPVIIVSNRSASLFSFCYEEKCITSSVSSSTPSFLQQHQIYNKEFINNQESSLTSTSPHNHYAIEEEYENPIHNRFLRNGIRKSSRPYPTKKTDLNFNNIDGRVRSEIENIKQETIAESDFNKKNIILESSDGHQDNVCKNDYSELRLTEMYFRITKWLLCLEGFQPIEDQQTGHTSNGSNTELPVTSENSSDGGNIELSNSHQNRCDCFQHFDALRTTDL